MSFKLYDTNKTAEHIAKRGGFSWSDLLMFLGREPKTWRANS
jgi:hypothetical protein